MKNAKNIPLSQNPGTLPDMSGTLMNWFQNVTFTRVTKSVVNHNLYETVIPFSFLGVVQPMGPETLETKSEGERSWKWMTVHALPDLVLESDEIIGYDGTNYRVKDKIDYKKYGYVEYHCVEDYTEEDQ